ncbi:MAG: hypothetical protein LBN11_06885 [Tannerella sp.]|nr:hypothetical protein [Tannerella sp.]
MKVFDNHEANFFGLNRAELKIYSFATEQTSPLTLGDLLELSTEERKKVLMQAVIDETHQFQYLEVGNVRDNQSLFFGEAGILAYRSQHIPEELCLQLWVIESDEKERQLAIEADEVLNNDVFKGLFATVTTALTAANPVLGTAIAVTRVIASLIQKKLKTNKDDLVGYWQMQLNRAEHYPHGTREKQDSPDTTGNILVDYTLFAYDAVAGEPVSRAIERPTVTIIS